MNTDVLIIGAGIAGLSAASELSAAGVSVAVLEARTRTGGRICTLHPPQLDVPVELGAEFVHDLSDELRALIERSQGRLIELGGEHWAAEAGALRGDDALFDRIGDVLANIARQLPPDRSVASALNALGDVSAEDRRRVLQYVEGYHAADAGRASAQAIVAAEAGEAAGPAGRQYRLEAGYTSIIRTLCDDLPRSATVTDARVTRIAWRRGVVHVTSSNADGVARDDTARAAIVTVPTGVLFAPPGAYGAIEIEPMPPSLTAASRALAMGSALRVALAFREPFWIGLRDVRGSMAQHVSFFHTASERLPVWWTQHPRPAPLLIGWAGGPAAATLATLDDDALCTVALDVLARQFGVAGTRLRDLQTGFWRSRWNDDPFSRGAYSYVLTDGLAASRVPPADGTLYFAGEGWADGATRGTVTGALASGLEAARAWLENDNQAVR